MSVEGAVIVSKVIGVVETAINSHKDISIERINAKTDRLRIQQQAEVLKDYNHEVTKRFEKAIDAQKSNDDKILEMMRIVIDNRNELSEQDVQLCLGLLNGLREQKYLELVKPLEELKKHNNIIEDSVSTRME